MPEPPSVTSPHVAAVTPLTRIHAARRALEERLRRLHAAERTHTVIAETGQDGLFWLALTVGLALVATRVLWQELAGQTVEVEGVGGLWHALLSAPSDADDPRVKVHALCSIAHEAAERREPLALMPDGTTTVHVDAWELCAALVDLPPLAVLSTRLIVHAGTPKRWVRFAVVSGGSWGVVAVHEVAAPTQKSTEAGQLQLPGVSSDASPTARPAVAREAPRHWPAAAPIVEVVR